MARRETAAAGEEAERQRNVAEMGRFGGGLANAGSALKKMVPYAVAVTGAFAVPVALPFPLSWLQADSTRVSARNTNGMLCSQRL